MGSIKLIKLYFIVVFVMLAMRRRHSVNKSMHYAVIYIDGNDGSLYVQFSFAFSKAWSLRTHLKRLNKGSTKENRDI